MLCQAKHLSEQEYGTDFSQPILLHAMSHFSLFFF